MSPQLDCLRRIGEDAGALILSYYRGGVEVERKSDDSPVTEADRRAEALILSRLAEEFPGIPMIAEEAAAAGKLPHIGERFFLIDPLDGTREFIGGRGDFTVNIALIDNGRPVMGLVHAPAHEKTFVGSIEDGAFLSRAGEGEMRRIRTRMADLEALTAVASRSHRSERTDLLLDTLAVSQRVNVGSSLKFCLVAQGEADFYPRFSRTMEWDTAAGHAVLVAAGGCLAGLDGGVFAYGKRNQTDDADFANPGFLAAGDPRIIDQATPHIGADL
ncbi:3'(2'),5'-bisphosphate nucleotidase CysQ [Stappia taiwanensis]|uniref:3'(2'),5'-bisphosphate nucleotidase CysQ n=1 Tax=Stappia taiwanensis TaxID=992267 RepID=A0A838XSJ3_9HYPH|nr:3'(2'),5'-bisphosphate nucleotidase CysQ [Stappia taiwanensis]MBA4610054.1 3'(2'),5'-bisphosphate nucleotidase CysQ [Stappia taiwanensis]GGE76568.1 3'(2'),5'-bisphosphate nucleotidase CysQ [Stappia taiwanensis]